MQGFLLTDPHSMIFAVLGEQNESTERGTLTSRRKDQGKGLLLYFLLKCR